MTTATPVSQQTPLRAFAYSVALDNYEPVPRSVEYGGAEVYQVPDSTEETIVLLEAFAKFGYDHATRAIFLVDDGSTVEPWYVAGWQPTLESQFYGCVFLRRFPLSQGTRPDNGRPVDMSGWMLGPRRCYHLKVRPL